MNKMKKTTIICSTLVIMLFVSLLAIGLIYKNKSKKYKDLEKELVEVTKTYTASDFNFPLNTEEIVITYEELKNAGLIKELKVEGQKCDGYVIMTFNNVTEYKGYVKCDKYKTHDFDSNKLEVK